MTNDYFSELVGEQMGAVTFVQDYLQLHFDGPCINVYMPMQIEAGGSVVDRKEEAFRNALCGQIAKRVSAVSFESEEALRISFEDGSRISISLRRADYTSPDAIDTHNFSRGFSSV
jgi:hypothetical protein